MTLREYWKEKIYQYGYDCGWLDRKASETNRPRRNPNRDIFYADEQDYYICADYYSSYVGDEKSWTQEDIRFLGMLGFGTGDFENQ